MILDRIRHWGQVRPDATAIVWNESSLSYERFGKAIAATRRFLASRALPESGTAIVLIPELLDAWLSILALRSLGLDTVAAASVGMAAGLDVRDAVCLVLNENQACDRQAIAAQFGGAAVIRVPRQLRHGDRPRRPRAGAPRAGPDLLWATRTTGQRKKVALDSATEDERNAGRARAYGYDRSTVFFGANFSLFTAVGYNMPSAVWHEGGTVVLDQRENVAGNLLAHPVTSLIMVPSLLRPLVASLPELPAPAREFELLVAGGFLPLELAEAAARRLTRAIGVFYASTELAAVTLRSRFTSVDDLVWLEPTGARELQIVDEQGRVLPAGHEGELRIRTTPLDARAYLDDPETSDKVFRDGFFHPGDMAVQREDGRIRILGRTADVLNVQGFKRAVAPIEQRIREFLRVDEVCVFSGLDTRGREELAVAIRTERTISRDELNAVAARLPQFRRIRFKVLPDFPRDETGLGKTQRGLLRQMLFPS